LTLRAIVVSEEIIAVRKISSNGRIQIPAEIRRNLKLSDGDSVLWMKSEDGKYYIRPQRGARRFVVE